MRSVSSLVLTSLVSGLILATNVHAQESNGSFDPSGTWAFNFGVEQVSFDKEQAYQEFIDDSATALNIEGEYFFRSHYSVTLGIQFLPYDDEGTFSQDTTGGYKSSDASGMPIYGELGYKRFFGPSEKTYVTARAGMSVMVASDRSISNCSNCYEEDIDIDGGFYGLLGAGVRLGQAWTLGVHYKSYFSGDIDNAVGIAVSYGYR
ncbi:MAG TPA: outer membrane beta-barrel protein [Cellvibrio sp.]|nr:outer membrane beta-barrel protein [Cellvibrio sp.]